MPGVFDKILENRNPYQKIGARALQSAKRRAGKIDLEGNPVEETPAPQPPVGNSVSEQPVLDSMVSGTLTPTTQNSGIDISSIIAQNLQGSRQLQTQNRIDSRRKEIQSMIDSFTAPNVSRNNNQLAGMNNTAYTPEHQNHSHGSRVTGENGRLDTSQLVEIAPGQHLQPDAAAAWNRMVQDAAADGVTLQANGAYRTYQRQVELAQEKGLYSQGGLAATPGTSNHGEALAVDVTDNPGEREWLAQNAGRYGFTTIPREPWHWEYVGG